LSRPLLLMDTALIAKEPRLFTGPMEKWTL